jgi:hypothetical protein
MSDQNNEATAEAHRLWDTAMKICGGVIKIAAAGKGVEWIVHTLLPIAKDLWEAGLFCPERFWYDGVQATQGQPPEVVVPTLDERLKDVLSRRDDSIRELSEYSNEQRQRINAAYEAILLNIQRDYPNYIQ